MKKDQEMHLNIKIDDPKEVWDKVPLIYEAMDGWLGFGKGGEEGEYGIPYWFSFNTDEKHVLASAEDYCILFSALMEDAEWEAWSIKIKTIATNVLGYKIGDVTMGEVDG